MKRNFALLAGLTGAAIALGSLATALPAGAAMRYYGQGRYYDQAPRERHYRTSRFHESPTYAPDAPAPRRFNNKGIPDFQDDAR